MPELTPRPIPQVDLQRRDTEIAVAAFRTVFILVIVFSQQFLQARGMMGSLLVISTIAGALYNLGLFILHWRGLPFPRPIIVTVDVLLISLWIYFAGPAGDRFFVAYFAVVIVAGLWFRVGGALAVALLACGLYTAVIQISPLPPGTDRTTMSTIALQIAFLILTAAVVSIASQVQERERQELLLSRAALRQHWQRIRIAQHVDDMLRPRRLPTTPGLDISFRFRPAAQAVSGDYYDVIPLGDRRWGICIADVRAKEEAGLFYLPLFKSSLRLAARRETSPARVLRQMNEEVAAQFEDTGESEAFISMSYTIVDLDAGELHHANAGIEAGVFLPASGPEITHFGEHGVVLGVMPDVPYEEQSIRIHQGDTLALFTDGITEASDEEGHFLGREGVVDLIRTAADAPTADEMARSIFQSVVEFAAVGARRDDMTLLVVRVTAADVGVPAEAAGETPREAG